VELYVFTIENLHLVNTDRTTHRILLINNAPPAPPSSYQATPTEALPYRVPPSNPQRSRVVNNTLSVHHRLSTTGATHLLTLAENSRRTISTRRRKQTPLGRRKRTA
jgi:hypothetical protein